MDIVVENLRGVIVLVASLLGFAAQAAPYVQASQNERAAEVYVDDDPRADVYRTGALAPLIVEPSRLDASRERSRNTSTSDVDPRELAAAPEKSRSVRLAPADAAPTALVRTVASARVLTRSSP